MSEELNHSEEVKPKNAYFIIDGICRAFDCREEIKSYGGFWNARSKFWEIHNPSDEARDALKQAGLMFQFSRKLLQ